MIDTKEAKTGKGFYCYLKKVLIIFSLLIITSCSFLFPKPPAQQPTTSPTEVPNTDLIVEGQFSDFQYQAAQKLGLNTPDQTEIYIQQGVVNSVITGSSIFSEQTPEEQIQTYFTEYDGLYQISQFSQNFQKVRQVDQPNGTQIQQFQQIINEIPVYRSDIRVMLDSQGTIALVNSNYMPDSLFPANFTPKLNSTSAKAAFETLNFSLPEDAQPTLVIYSPIMDGEKNPSFLAWLAKAGWEKDFGDVLIKDSDGSLVLSSTDIKTFSYEIRDGEGQNFTKKNPPSQTDLNAKPLLASSSTDSVDNQRTAHLVNNYEQVITFYHNELGYSSFMTFDSNLQILIDSTYEDIQGPYSFRSDKKSIPPLISYPDRSFEESIDVFAHEFQHLVTGDFVNLESNYKNSQPSALDEAISDFFGAIADTSDYRWQVNLGDTIYRDMRGPVSGVSGMVYPDHMDDFVNPSIIFRTDEEDYGNGHINCTIISHALYLISEGGEKNGIRVFPIGINDTAQIVFNSLPILNDNANFLGFRNAMLLMCRALSPSGNYESDYCNQIQNAFAIVGIGEFAPESNNIEYEQIKIWNWGNHEFYLTYDPADWEATEYASLISKSYPYCVVASNGFRDGGPEGPPPYTYASDTKILDGIEYFIDIEIPNATGIPDMFHVYWEEHQNAVALFPDPDGFDECVAAFWEVMQLSAANNFAP